MYKFVNVISIIIGIVIFITISCLSIYILTFKNIFLFIFGILLLVISVLFYLPYVIKVIKEVRIKNINVDRLMQVEKINYVNILIIVMSYIYLIIDFNLSIFIVGTLVVIPIIIILILQIKLSTKNN